MSTSNMFVSRDVMTSITVGTAVRSASCVPVAAPSTESYMMCILSLEPYIKPLGQRPTIHLQLGRLRHMSHKKTTAKLTFEPRATNFTGSGRLWQGHCLGLLGDCIHRQAQGAAPRVRGKSTILLSDISAKRLWPPDHSSIGPLSWGHKALNRTYLQLNTGSYTESAQLLHRCVRSLGKRFLSIFYTGQTASWELASSPDKRPRRYQGMPWKHRSQSHPLSVKTAASFKHEQVWTTKTKEFENLTLLW